MMRNRTLAAWALLWATLVSSGAAQDAVIEDDAPVLVGDEADDAPLLTENRPSWFDEVNAPIDHPLAPELCWQGPDWLRPFCAYPRAGYRASIDVVILSRATPSDVPLLRDVTTGAELLNADDMTFNPEIGPRFTFVAPLTDRWDLEFRIFGVDGWRSQKVTPGPVQLRIPGPPDSFEFRLANSPLLDYRSKLGSEELNLRRNVNSRLSVLGGFRALQLKEAFNASTFLTRLYEVSTDNRLYGVQAGADYQLIAARRIELSTFVRAGLYNNDSEQETNDSSSIFAITPANRMLRDTSQHAAFAVEAGLIGSIRFWDFLYLRGGYQVLHVEGVALAPDQIPINNFAPLVDPQIPQVGLDDDNHVFYHGAVAGLEVRW